MGPLKGIRIIEFAGIGPGPFCAMMLSDMGADIIRIDRKTRHNPLGGLDLNSTPVHRGRRSLALDLKATPDRRALLKLIAGCDGLIDVYRPGVMEKLGLGPEVCLELNPGLVYGRMTGWGQDGPLAEVAGHDLNYVALSGVLHAFADDQGKPITPPPFIGDFAGGAMYMAFGMVCGLFNARLSGQGQVVDATMSDGVANLYTTIYGLLPDKLWSNKPKTNPFDGASHFYNVYECSDGKFVSLAAIESPFYALLLELLNLDEEFNEQWDKEKWPRLKARLATLFQTRTRDQWCQLLEGTDVCFAPVLDLEEAPEHPHNLARKTFMQSGGITHPSPSPRFSRTSPETGRAPPKPGEHSVEILREAGLSDEEIDEICGN